jgi:hypothetical protein
MICCALLRRISLGYWMRYHRIWRYLSRIEALGYGKLLIWKQEKINFEKEIYIVPQQHLRGASSHKLKAIVSRLNGLEELAGMSILCSDKTVTLTKNELTIINLKSYQVRIERNLPQLHFPCRRQEGHDAIDLCITQAKKS